VIEPGLSFGAAAEAYDRGRPDWPAELVAEVPVRAGGAVVDLGAGTGKLTRLLARRFRHVIAVEPDEAMRARIPVGEPLAGSAEAIPLKESSVAAVFVGEAFHWFDWDQAVAEIARVLVPRGALALLWNRFAEEDHLLPQGVMPPPRGAKHGTFASGAWRRAFDGGPFELFRQREVAQERDVRREQLLDYFASVSPITSLSSAERADALARVEAALHRPVYRQRWTACLYWTRLRS